MAEELRVSLTQFSEGGGGLPSNQDMEILQTRFISYNWPNKEGVSNSKPSLVLKLVVKLEDGTEYTDHLSAGSLDYFVPSLDGKGIVRVGAIELVGKTFDFARFVHSLIEHGLDPAKFDGDISKLEGVVFHGVREQTGMNRKGKDGKEWPITYLAASEVKRAPWDAKGKSAKGAGAAGAAVVDEDTANVAKSAALTVLSANGGKIGFKQLGIKVFAALTKTDKVNAGPASKLLGDQAFINSMVEDGLVEFDGTTVTAA